MWRNRASPIPLPRNGRLDEHVLDEQAAATREGAEGEGPEREAHRLPAGIDQDGLDRWVGCEQRVVQAGLGDGEAVLQFLVGREVAHQPMQRGNVGRPGRPETEIHASR